MRELTDSMLLETLTSAQVANIEARTDLKWMKAHAEHVQQTEELRLTRVKIQELSDELSSLLSAVTPCLVDDQQLKSDHAALQLKMTELTRQTQAQTIEIESLRTQNAALKVQQNGIKRPADTENNKAGQAKIIALEKKVKYLNEEVQKKDQLLTIREKRIGEYATKIQQLEQCIGAEKKIVEADLNKLKKEIEAQIAKNNALKHASDIKQQLIDEQIAEINALKKASTLQAISVTPIEEPPSELHPDFQKTSDSKGFFRTVAVSDFQRMSHSQGFFKTLAIAADYQATVNLILQDVVHGKEAAVSVALESVRGNHEKLARLLSGRGTVKDYSDRTVTGMTLLQASAAAGDIDMCLMLKNYLSPEMFSIQLAEIFPEGFEAHVTHQQREAFNFDTILAAIHAANTTHLDAALSKTDNASALCRALKEFRHQFTEISHQEKIFNPYHLLRAIEAYSLLLNQYKSNFANEKFRLFWCQIIGYIQRFAPACYAQAFAQGLYNLVKVNQPDKSNDSEHNYKQLHLFSCQIIDYIQRFAKACYPHDFVKVDQPDSWRLETFKRDLKLENEEFSYFPLTDDCWSGLGFDFAVYNYFGMCFSHPTDAELMGIFSKTFIEQKQQAFKILCRESNCGIKVQNDERLSTHPS